MPASNDLVSRARELTREVLHDGLARIREESPPQVARRVAQLDRWIRDQEKTTDRRRKNFERWVETQSDELRSRIEGTSDDVRARIAQAIRDLERRVRPV